MKKRWRSNGRAKPFSRYELKRWLYRKFRGRCHYCRVQLTFELSTIDHKRAQARGGTYEKRNLALACKRCNGEKGCMPYHDYVCIWRERHNARVDSAQLRMLDAA